MDLAPGTLGKLAWKLRGETKFQGLPIAIEQYRGDARSGTSPDGTKWRTMMRHPYGYIKGTKGRDGDEIDCFIGPDKGATHAHVVHQHKPDGTGHDEDKVILGVGSKEEAKKLYLANYDKKGPTMLGPITSIPMEALKAKLQEKKHWHKLAEAIWR